MFWVTSTSTKRGWADSSIATTVSVRGDSGRVLVMTDARGRSFNSVEQPVLPGANLVTTIDENIQYIVEKEIAATAEKTHAKGISIVVMDPRSGEILAMGNYPTFNPNEYAKYSPQAWINRAVSHTYEPGSTFKIVTAASAFEEGLAEPERRHRLPDGFDRRFWTQDSRLEAVRVADGEADHGELVRCRGNQDCIAARR